jgi:hypothetical protein
MSDGRRFCWMGSIALAISVWSGAALAAEPPDNEPGRPTKDCFFVNEWQGWKSPGPDVIYLGVRMHDVYRVDLSGGSPLLQGASMHLVLKVRGTDLICSALDLDLSVADEHGILERLIAKSITKLTPEEVAAIPPKYRP